MPGRNLDRTLIKYRRWLTESRGKTAATAYVYGGAVKKLLARHPEGATYDQIQQFIAENPSASINAAVKSFSEFAALTFGAHFAVNPEGSDLPIPVSEAHRTLWALFQAMEPPLPLTVTWEMVPPVSDWVIQGGRLVGQQVHDLDLMLRNVRRAGRGSHLVFAKVENTLIHHFTEEELEFPDES